MKTAMLNMKDHEELEGSDEDRTRTSTARDADEEDPFEKIPMSSGSSKSFSTMAPVQIHDHLSHLQHSTTCQLEHPQPRRGV